VAYSTLTPDSSAALSTCHGPFEGKAGPAMREPATMTPLLSPAVAAAQTSVRFWVSEGGGANALARVAANHRRIRLRRGKRSAAFKGPRSQPGRGGAPRSS